MWDLEAIAELWGAIAVRMTCGLAAGTLLVSVALRLLPRLGPESRHGFWAIVIAQGLLWLQVPIWLPARGNTTPSIAATLPATGLATASAALTHTAESVTVSASAVHDPASLATGGESDADSMRRWPTYPELFVAWSVIVCALGAQVAWRSYRFRRRLLWVATPVSNAVIAIGREQMRRIGVVRAVPIVSSPACAVPLVMGWRRATIVVPPAFAAWAKDEQAAVLAHELAHVRRGDSPLATLAHVAWILNFFNPCVWFACRALARSRESCVDALVTGPAGHAPVTYARALLRVAEGLVARPQPAWLTAGGTRGELAARIAKLLERPSPHTRSRWPAVLVAALLVEGVAASLVSVRELPAANAEPVTATTDGEPAAIGAKDEPAAEKPAGEDRIATPPNDVALAVAAGLRFLEKRQNNGGGFDVDPAGNALSNDTGVVALAGLAFIASGSKPGEGPYGEATERSLKFVLSQARDDGYLAGQPPKGHGSMYSHGLATLFLARSGVVAVRPEVKQALDKAVALIAKAQHESGGWRYQPAPQPGDSSVTACQLYALAAAREAGCEFSVQVIDRAAGFLRRCRNADGGFAYQEHLGGQSSFGCSAAALAALDAAGVARDEERSHGRAFLHAHAPTGVQATPGINFFYGHYYAAAIFGRSGSDERTKWLTAIRHSIVASRAGGDDGAWRDAVGPEYATAMACLILQTPDK